MNVYSADLDIKFPISRQLGKENDQDRFESSLILVGNEYNFSKVLFLTLTNTFSQIDVTESTLLSKQTNQYEFLTHGILFKYIAIYNNVFCKFRGS